MVPASSPIHDTLDVTTVDFPSHPNMLNLPLNYLQQSPVRGQLEPCDDGTKWRYLQCTDTPGELKVLLPPATAWMYEQLLKAEVSELANAEVVSWTVVAEIRHLKDRMIRKCLRISQTLSSRRYGESFSFYTIRAPPDFRLKEMEKWLQRYQANARREAKKKQSEPRLRNSYCCSRCAASLTPATAHNPDIPTQPQTCQPSLPLPPVSTVPSISNLANSNSGPSCRKARTPLISSTRDSPRSITEEGRHALREEATERFAGNAKALIQNHSIPGVEPISPASEEPSSPPPLPFLWRMPSGSSPPAVLEADISSDTGGTQYVLKVNDAAAPHVQQDDTRPLLHHRRSSLKRVTCRPSVNDIKSVSWAADRDWTDQMGRYEKAARDVRDVGNEWENIRITYTTQMAGLSALHKDVIQGLDQLRAQTETLQRAEDTIRCQQEMLRATCEQLEDKQSQYQATVLAALEETDHVLSLCSLKREEELDS